jgi:hypothetical protein
MNASFNASYDTYWESHILWNPDSVTNSVAIQYCTYFPFYDRFHYFHNLTGILNSSESVWLCDGDKYLFRFKAQITL